MPESYISPNKNNNTAGLVGFAFYAERGEAMGPERERVEREQPQHK